MPVQGNPKFDAIALIEIEAINFVQSADVLVGHAAFVDTKTGVTYGRTRCARWSQETLRKVVELREAMEQDIAATVFEIEAQAPQPQLGGAPAGIGEHAVESV